MPKASAPNAPWVAVCESPHTIVMPGWVSPSSGPMTCTIPWCGEPMPVERDAELARSSPPVRATCLAAISSTIGRKRSVVGIEWSTVATVWPGRRTREPALAQAVEGLWAGHLVDEVQVNAEHVGRAVGASDDDVVVPDLLDDRLAGVA